MPSIQFEEAGCGVTAEEGQDIRKIAHKNKVTVYGGPNKYFNCRGFGLCGTDRITVKPDDAVSPPTWKEKLHFGDKPKIRLACQARLLGDATVSIAPAEEYGAQMKETLKLLPAVVFFGGLTLFFVVFMLFELVGKPLF